MEIGLSLGSNLGNRLSNIQTARDHINAIANVRLSAQSPVYQTEPVGVSEPHKEKKFLNVFLILETECTVTDIFEETSAIEDSMGRKRTDNRFDPRIIDIDIIFAGSTVTKTNTLTVPHSQWRKRRFVLQPLRDLRPNLILPEETQTVSDILAKLPNTPIAELFSTEW